MTGTRLDWLLIFYFVWLLILEDQEGSVAVIVPCQKRETNMAAAFYAEKWITTDP